MDLLDKLKSTRVGEKSPVRWRGPEADGVTQSLVARFLQCRERFGVYTIGGLKPRDRFNHRIFYGELWHACEEAHAKGLPFGSLVDAVADEAGRKYPHDREEITKWKWVCLTQFPVYARFWEKWAKSEAVTPLLQEQVFDVPYRLPSGRVVRLRGKWDGVNLHGSEVYLFETKTKGDVRPEQVTRQLSFDLQTMMYLIALKSDTNTEFPPPIRTAGYLIKGVVYNVVRRPLSGGKGTIVQHKARGNKPAESTTCYFNRLRQIIDGTGEDAPGPSSFFMRFKVTVTDGDVQKFCDQCLDPILEQMCTWYGHITDQYGDTEFVKYNIWDGLHYRMPYGVNLPLLEGGVTDYDEFLDTGSRLGLEPVKSYFGELE